METDMCYKKIDDRTFRLYAVGDEKSYFDIKFTPVNGIRVFGVKYYENNDEVLLETVNHQIFDYELLSLLSRLEYLMNHENKVVMTNHVTQSGLSIVFLKCDHECPEDIIILLSASNKSTQFLYYSAKDDVRLWISDVRRKLTELYDDENEKHHHIWNM